MTDARAALLSEWAQKSRPGCRVAPLADDASFRRYFRVFPPNSTTLVAMDAPPPRENAQQFAAAQKFMSDRVSVPEILAADFQQGFLLLEDFGDQTYAQALQSGANPAPLHQDAARALAQLQLPPLPKNFPRYDEILLRREMALFPEWHCRRALNHPLRATAWQVLAKMESMLVAEILQMPIAFTHRDYHSRNLMVLPPKRNPGMLDFQDATLGPVAYDLASLARDAYLPPDEKRCQLVLDSYWDAAKENKLSPATSRDALRRDFELLSVQRGLKVMGIFCRLALRDGKPNYLSDIPTVRQNTLAACDNLPQLRELGKVLADIPPPNPSALRGRIGSQS